MDTMKQTDKLQKRVDQRANKQRATKGPANDTFMVVTRQ